MYVQRSLVAALLNQISNVYKNDTISNWVPDWGSTICSWWTWLSHSSDVLGSCLPGWGSVEFYWGVFIFTVCSIFTHLDLFLTKWIVTAVSSLVARTAVKLHGTAAQPTWQKRERVPVNTFSCFKKDGAVIGSDWAKIHTPLQYTKEKGKGKKVGINSVGSFFLLPFANWRSGVIC